METPCKSGGVGAFVELGEVFGRGGDGLRDCPAGRFRSAPAKKGGMAEPASYSQRHEGPLRRLTSAPPTARNRQLQPTMSVKMSQGNFLHLNKYFRRLNRPLPKMYFSRLGRFFCIQRQRLAARLINQRFCSAEGATQIRLLMSKHYRPWNIDEPMLLLPATVQEFVGKDHLARFVLGLVVDPLDLEESEGVYRSERGQPAFDPEIMTALLLYAYRNGIYSSRRIAKASRERVRLHCHRWARRPGRTISEFRRRHLKALAIASP